MALIGCLMVMLVHGAVNSMERRSYSRTSKLDINSLEVSGEQKSLLEFKI